MRDDQTSSPIALFGVTEDGGGGGGRDEEEENENKVVMVWNYVMFVLGGWFGLYGKADVVERAKEVFSLKAALPPPKPDLGDHVWEGKASWTVCSTF